MRVRTGLVLAASSALALVSLPAHSSLITFDFEATPVVNGIPLDFQSAFGTSLTGSYTFDSSTPDSASSSVRGSYVGTVTEFVFSTACSIGPCASGSGGNGTITVDNGDVLGNLYDARPDLGTVSGARVADTDLVAFAIELFDLDGAALDSDALPVTAESLLPLDQYESNQLFLQYEDGAGSSAQLFFRLTALSTRTTSVPVPAPATLLLLCLGLAGLGLGYRRH